MVQSAYSRSVSQRQMSLLEHALRQLSKIDQADWNAIPVDLHLSFARYMGDEVWTHAPDLFTLREAALMIIRDAILHAGEFSDGEESISAGG
jgi:hypothetical protein